MSGEEADFGVRFLEQLLAYTERSPDRSRPASTVPDYGFLRTAESLGRFHAMMAAAERAGAIEVVRGRRERSHLIERVAFGTPRCWRDISDAIRQSRWPRGRRANWRRSRRGESRGSRRSSPK
jgi:hypothetical protein